MRERPMRLALALVWACFVLRGMFYSALLPLWEGYDEWAHFAYVQHVAGGGWISTPGKTKPSREVTGSLRLTPVPWSQLTYAPGSIPYEKWWKLTPGERADRERALAMLSRDEYPAADPNYESQQPPLYYWLAALPLRAASALSLPARVFVLRCLGVLIASLAIPLGFVAARRLFGNGGTALAAVALAVVMPEFMIDVARVGNDCVSVALYTMLLVLLTDVARRRARWSIVLGLGLLNKAFFLTAIPVVAVASGWLAIAGAGAIGGWWYWLMHHWTGTWTGQTQTAVLAHVGFGDKLRAAMQIDWLHALDTLVRTHVWFGGWSFLQVRGWMYRVFFALFGAASVGLAVALARQKERRREVLLLVALEVCLLCSLAYHVVVTYLANNVAATNGWYLYGPVMAEVVLLGLGLRALFPERARRFVVPAVAALFAVLDVYGVCFVLIPYYHGLTAHTATGSVTSFHLGDLARVGMRELMARFGTMRPVGAAGFVMLWAAWLGATVACVAVAFRMVGHCCADDPRRGAISVLRPPRTV